MEFIPLPEPLKNCPDIAEHCHIKCPRCYLKCLSAADKSSVKTSYCSDKIFLGIIASIRGARIATTDSRIDAKRGERFAKDNPDLSSNWRAPAV